jgi:hypothetical protein
MLKLPKQVLTRNVRPNCGRFMQFTRPNGVLERSSENEIIETAPAELLVSSTSPRYLVAMPRFLIHVELLHELNE